MKRVLTITPLNVVLLAEDSFALLVALESFYTYFSASSVSLDKTSITDPRQYTYKIVAQDGRIWKQTITCDIPSDPVMTFNVADTWRASEFSSQRKLRALLVSFVNKYTAIDKITYTST